MGGAWGEGVGVGGRHGKDLLPRITTEGERVATVGELVRMLVAGGGETLYGKEDEVTAQELVDEMLVGYDSAELIVRNDKCTRSVVQREACQG